MSPEPVPAVDGVVSRLLEELLRTAEFGEACSMALASALEHSPFDRGAVVLKRGDSLHAVCWRGEGEARERRVIAAGDAGGALTEALGSRAGAVTLVDPEPLGLRGLRPCTALPFEPASEDPMGGVLLPGTVDGEHAGRIRSILGRVAPALARILELEELRRRSRETELDNGMFGQLLDLLPDPVLLTNSTNDYLLANQRARKLFSTRDGDSEGRSRAVHMNTALFSAFLTQLVIGGDDERGRELNLVEPSDGSDLLFEVLARPLPATTDDDYFVISVLRDITDLKRAVMEIEREFGRSRAAEHRARQETRRMNAVIENAGEPILVSDGESNIVLMNVEAERLFDVPSDGLDDPRLRRQLWANVTRFTTLVNEFLLQPLSRRVDKLALVEPATGRDLPAEIVNTKISDVREGTSAVVSVLRDLTQAVENERLARELRLLNDELEDRVRVATGKLEERNRVLEWQSQELKKASRLKSEFVASMSHELRTPINAILGYTSLLRESVYGKLSDPQEHALGKIEAASEHLLVLINDILDLSRIEAGRTPVHVTEVSIDALITEISETIDPMVNERGLGFRVEVGDDLPLLRTDRTKLKQVLLNLLDNALKYTSRGSVALRAGRGAGEAGVRFEVEDTGIGIEGEDLEVIFDDFRQADQSPGRRFGGTGLGLSISRKLLHLIGGSIAVESTPGEGSRFTIELPIEIGGEGPGQPTGGRPAPAGIRPGPDSRPAR